MSSMLISKINYISAAYYYYACIFLFTVGLISNICLILVFITLRIFRRNQCAFFLMVESASNIGLFLTTFLPFFYICITGQNPVHTSLIWCKLQSGLSQSFGLCSVLTICFLSFDQYMSTNLRHSWRQISTLKFARYLTFINIIFVILHSVPFYIFTEIRPVEGCTIYSPALQSYFTFFYYPVLSFMLPFTVTVTFSLLAYHNVRRIVRRQIPLVRRRLDRQLTAMVLARVLYLILLGVPYVIYSMYRLQLRITNNNPLEVAIANLAGTIAYSLIYMNFASSFFLFLIISSRFRRQVKYLLTKKFWKLLTGFCHMTSPIPTRNQVVPETVQAVISYVESE